MIKKLKHLSFFFVYYCIWKVTLYVHCWFTVPRFSTSTTKWVRFTRTLLEPMNVDDHSVAMTTFISYFKYLRCLWLYKRMKILFSLYIADRYSEAWILILYSPLLFAIVTFLLMTAYDVAAIFISNQVHDKTSQTNVLQCQVLSNYKIIFFGKQISTCIRGTPICFLRYLLNLTVHLY